MKKLTRQDGFILLFTLFLLSCTMLWGSLLLLALSDQYEASNGAVQKEQSRLLAYSGWNLALQQLESNGDRMPIVQNESAGNLHVAMNEIDSGLIAVEVKGEAGQFISRIDGKVSLQASAWAEVLEWPVIQNIQQMKESSRLLTKDTYYELTTDCMYPLAIGAMDGEPITVEISKPISMETLYIDGDLFVHAPAQLVTLCVSGQITGLENIDCQQIIYADEPSLHYRIEVLERDV